MEEEEFFRRYPNQTKAWYKRCKERDYFSNPVYFPELVREKERMSMTQEIDNEKTFPSLENLVLDNMKIAFDIFITPNLDKSTYEFAKSVLIMGINYLDRQREKENDTRDK